ncbi:hypothetical protein OWM54_16930 [Myxococcus sp. MISCRS1]|jgi:hypothetical protein|uniref:hypothetical protein n=1 Tax=Myxococcus sp. MISCRS1 TaxID=2996786 RepID=UPI001D4668A4|nr:hypothetical protein [Myxococcus sp. MISCRS1]MBZ4411428.1 hypothetical protein [Myxococcus sp. XM-1-1-1]MCY0998826.1 hypothetical protein [Myxococcus sp. MISCRS1]BDT31173.1 hypothetical protein MFMH1_08420 [Myxococcus sp. MH1]
MRRVVLIAALGLGATAAFACKTTQPPGTETQAPIQGPDQVREPVQTVPNEPPGPATPMPAEADAGTTQTP